MTQAQTARAAFELSNAEITKEPKVGLGTLKTSRAGKRTDLNLLIVWAVYQYAEMLIELVLKVHNARARFYRAVETSDSAINEAGREYEAVLDEYMNDLSVALEDYIGNLRKDPAHPAAHVGSDTTKKYGKEGMEWASAEKEKVRTIIHQHEHGSR